MNMYQTIFAPVTQLLTHQVKLCSFIQIFVTARTQSQHPKKPGHMSFHIKYSAAHTKARHIFHYGTEGWPKGLRTATMSCMAIYGIKRFNFRVAAPCMPSCLKIYLCYELFPSLNSSFTILFNYFSLSLCFLSPPNWQCFHFYLM